MNTTIRSLMSLQSIQASGTSEGVKKAWESREHGSGKTADDETNEPSLKMKLAWRMGSEETKDFIRQHAPEMAKALDSSPLFGKNKPKFGEGGKSRPAWGYGGDDHSEYGKWFNEQKKGMKGHEGETSQFGNKHINAPI